MSYTYLQGQGEESSAATYSDIPASVLSNGTHTPGESYSRGSVTTCYRASRFGMMSRHSTASRGKGASMLSQAVSRVRTYPQLEKALALTAQSRECGDTWPESLARYDRDSCLWRTPHSLFPEDWIPLSGTFPPWGMLRYGESLEPMTQAFPTNGNESGLWVTPSARDWKDTPGMSKTREAGRTRVDQLARQVYASQDGSQLFTPPTATEAETALDVGMILEIAGVQGLPWMNVNTSNTRATYTGERVSGLLNPPWVEWLMGWPIGFTDLQPLETVKYRQWLRSHGAR